MKFFDKEKQEEAILFALHDYNKLREVNEEVDDD